MTVTWLLYDRYMTITWQCVVWGLTMAEMLLPAEIAWLETSGFISMLRGLAPSALHTCFVTCLIAFCLGHRTVGEVEVESGSRRYDVTSM